MVGFTQDRAGGLLTGSGPERPSHLCSGWQVPTLSSLFWRYPWGLSSSLDNPQPFGWVGLGGTYL